MAFITTTANSISSGGTISGDITIEGDLTVNGDGAGAYDEIVDGNLRISSTNKLEFGDTGTYIHQSADGVLDLVSDTTLELNGGSGSMKIDTNSRISLSNNGGEATNTIFGYQAGNSIHANSGNNTFFGHQVADATMTNTSDDNTGIGYIALGSLLAGSNNTAVGSNTLKFVEAGGYNTAVGVNAGSAFDDESHNTYVGYAAGSSGHAAGCTALGSNALAGVTNSDANNTVAIGKESLNALTTGSSNIAIGYQSMKVHTTGGKNVCIGYQTMLDTDDAGGLALTSSENVFIGYQVGSGTWENAACNHNVGIGNDVMRGALNGALYNVAVGSEALMSVTTGDANIVAGYQAGNDITTGEANICIGNRAGDEFDAENYNIFIGEDAGGGAINGADKCIAIGKSALDGAITQDGTIAIGHDSLSGVTSGNYNLAIGFEAAKGITTGTSNIAIGYQAFDSANGAEDNNIAIGVSALGNADHDDLERNIAIGHYAGDGMGAFANLDNIFIGHGAGGGTWTGNNCDSNVGIGNYSMDAAMNDANNNTALGHQALSALTTANGNVCNGFQSGVSITEGIHNIGIGYQSCATTTTGDGNVMIGTGSTSSGADVNDQIVINAGYDGVVSAGTETIRIGVDSDFVTLDFGGGGETWSHTSDERIKKEINDTDIGLDFINDLRPVTFKRKAPSEYPKSFDTYNETKTERNNPDRINYGFIAQEVKESMDKVNHSNFTAWIEREDGCQELGETMLIVPLVKAIQELTAKVKELESKL